LVDVFDDFDKTVTTVDEAVLYYGMPDNADLVRSDG